jgi:6-phosphogluconolactonase
MMSEGGAVRISPNVQMLTTTAADLMVSVIQEAVAARGRADVTLTGGSSPTALYQLLATPAYAGKIPWAQVHIWFSDERCVPPDDKLSNYKLAHDTLLSKVPIPAAQVHRMHGEDPRDAAAEHYAEELRRSFGLEPVTNPSMPALPRMDFILLGLGPDGHVASLFPGNPAVRVEDRLVVGVEHHTPPEPLVDRISLTLPVLNAGAVVAFIVTSAEKAGITAKVLEDIPANPQDLLPAQRVKPTQGQLLWLLDMASAGELHM